MSQYDPITQTWTIEWGLRRGHDWSSKAIGWFGSGYFSHVDVLDPEGDGWWGARSDEVYALERYWPKGFQWRPFDYEPQDALWIFSLSGVTESQYQSFWAFNDKQEDKPYDWQAILAFAVPSLLPHRKWRDPSAWFCSEEQTANCEQAGVFERLWERFTSVTPGGFAGMLTARGAKYKRVR